MDISVLGKWVAYQKLQCFKLDFTELSIFGVGGTKVVRFTQSQQSPTTFLKGKKAMFVK